MSTPTSTDPPRWEVAELAPEDWAPEGTTAYNESPSAHDCRGDDDPTEGLDGVQLPAISSGGAVHVPGLMAPDYRLTVRCVNEAADCSHLDADHAADGGCVVPGCGCEGLVRPDVEDEEE